MLEGTDRRRARRKAGGSTPSRALVQFDTRNVLFICGGAFDGLGASDRPAACSRGQIGFQLDGCGRARGH